MQPCAVLSVGVRHRRKAAMMHSLRSHSGYSCQVRFGSWTAYTKLQNGHYTFHHLESESTILDVQDTFQPEKERLS